MEKVTGIILAGGKSSRMGRDKSFAEIGGRKFIEHVIAALEPVVSDIIIVANGPGYDGLGYKVYADLLKDRGPAGGIHTGLSFSEAEKNVIVSCDTPFVSSQLLAFLLGRSGGHEITLPVHGGAPEPLCGVYRRSCLEKLEALIRQGNLRMQELVRAFDLEEVNVEKETFYNGRLLANLNSPEEIMKYGGMNDDR